MITQYRTTWNVEKKKSINEHKRKVFLKSNLYTQKSTLRQREDSSDENGEQTSVITHPEKKVNVENPPSTSSITKSAPKEGSVEKTAPKKLDLKRLAFALDDEDECNCLFKTY